MIAVDSSVAIVAFGEWHHLNQLACVILDEGAAIPEHAMLETYSVLTGFRAPHRASPRLVREWLDDRFANVQPSPDTSELRELEQIPAQADRAGGGIYDALVALTAGRAGVTLVFGVPRRPNDLIGVEARPLLEPTA